MKYLRYYGIKAIDFDSLGLSASHFDDLNITARNFDLYSKSILMINFFHFMYSPFTGILTSIPDIINQLANFHKLDPISALEFDNLNLSTSSFDSKLISAYNFDFNAKALLNI